MRLIALLALVALPAFAAEPPTPLRIVPVEGGGFAIERDAGVAKVEATGIATVAEIMPLLAADAKDGVNVDYSNGVKFEGVYTIVVGREDGTLAKYEGASDVVAFVAPQSMAKAGKVTTLGGAIVFALKIDNNRAVQRLERGAVTLTQTKSSI